MDTSNGARAASITVSGFSSGELKLAAELKSDSAWQMLLRVTVGDSNATPILGQYTVNDSAVVFTPKFPFDAGRQYGVRVDAWKLQPAKTNAAADSSQLPHKPMIAQFSLALPAGNQQAATTVVRMLPSGDVLPENLLRLYFEFSAPMSRTSGLDFIKLLDDKGREVKAAFLPLDADFWNHERTRYTAFLDPGRVKLGILPNEQMGRALVPGRRYAIVVDSAWRDENGLPLLQGFRREFSVSAAETRRIDFKQWKLTSPRSSTRDTLTVSFERPLDHGLLKRALGVELKGGAGITGTTTIVRDEREWRFVPDAPWPAGDFNLVIFSILEDAAGNRVDGAFEVDMFNEIDKAGKQERYVLPFKVSK